MVKIFSRTFRVRFDEVDVFGRVGSQHILRYFVETAWDWGASEGLTVENSAHQNLLWLIREMELGKDDTRGFMQKIRGCAIENLFPIDRRPPG